MANTTPKFIKGKDSHNGLAGYLHAIFRAFGTATVASGQTSVDVTDADVATGDVIIASAMTKGTNASYVQGVTISAGTKFTITVSADPGSGGVVVSYIRLRPQN